MTLCEMVKRYLEIAGSYGKTVPLERFGFSQEQIESVFSVFDEDYHISRYFHLSGGPGQSYMINGFPHSQLSIDEGIDSVL